MPDDTAQARRRWRAAAERAVTRVGERILGEAQREAPIREGTLRASGELEVDSRPGEVVAVVSFNEVYAARQHEELDWEHPLGGKAKYLEDPVKRNGARARPGPLPRAPPRGPPVRRLPAILAGLALEVLAALGARWLADRRALERQRITRGMG
jgi:hypothetical protein